VKAVRPAFLLRILIFHDLQYSALCHSGLSGILLKTKKDPRHSGDDRLHIFAGLLGEGKLKNRFSEGILRAMS
jgi:hypothetical protein